MSNPLLRLRELGQSVWLDYIRRDLFDGELDRLIEEDGLAGMTSNPTIFDGAISDTDLYDDVIRECGPDMEPDQIFEKLAVADVRQAADHFRPLFDRTEGRDGFVSIEVRPALANDTEATIEEVQRLWTSCDRPNVMVKIPGTREGLPAIRQCLFEGININITLLFSVERYLEVMDAWFDAFEERIGAGQPVDRLASVASFFVSRVDTKVDERLEALLEGDGGRETARIRGLLGQAGITNAKIAYERFEERFRSARFAALEEKGARLQRPLWASTSTKNPAYPDTYYVDNLIAPETV
ncbi:MAG TPA: transaldolase, partial [Gemmatimonadota bacterium]|nr:transaldolase [Gemmatimonadota bacterium]